MWKVFGEFLRFSNLKLKRTHDTQSLPVGKIGARVLCARIHTILCCQTIRHHWLNSKIENFHSFDTQLNSIAFSLSAASFWLLCLASHTITDRHTDWLVGWLVGWLVVWLKTMRPNHWIRHLLHTRNPPSCTVFASRINRQNYWVLRFSVTHDNRTDFYSLYIYK